MRRLWGRPSSSNVQKVLWALHELDLPYEHRIVGGPHGGTDTAEFAALAPLRKVPVLQDGALTLWESHAILRHIARADGASGTGALTPGSPQEAALVDQWLDFGLTLWQPALTGLFWALVRLPDTAPERAAVPQYVADLNAASAILEAQLASGPYLLGDRLGLADIGLGTLLYRYYDLDWQRPDRPRLAAWHAQLRGHEGFRIWAEYSYDELRVPAV